jgi:hypothetical protein
MPAGGGKRLYPLSLFTLLPLPCTASWSNLFHEGVHSISLLDAPLTSMHNRREQQDRFLKLLLSGGRCCMASCTSPSSRSSKNRVLVAMRLQCPRRYDGEAGNRMICHYCQYGQCNNGLYARFTVRRKSSSSRNTDAARTAYSSAQTARSLREEVAALNHSAIHCRLLISSLSTCVVG